MQWGRALRLFLLAVSFLLVGFSGDPVGKPLRYRGDYTYGHEVRSFCPSINSQCFWVGADTGAAVRATLKELATVSGAPYTPVCVVIEGRIDRESKRTGFAADYDGLIAISRVFHRCDQTDIVTQGDLQHHRWLLESIDDKPLDAEMLHGMVPELDFGERLTVAGNAGCNRFTGRVVLREQFFVIEQMALTSRACVGAQDEVERTVLQVLGNDSVVTVNAAQQLILRSDQAVLRFRLLDCRK